IWKDESVVLKFQEEFRALACRPFRSVAVVFGGGGLRVGGLQDRSHIDGRQK
ncbi:hypothetical protein L195_g035614, partial [Trifolium pratense]